MVQRDNRSVNLQVVEMPKPANEPGALVKSLNQVHTLIHPTAETNIMASTAQNINPIFMPAKPIEFQEPDVNHANLANQQAMSPLPDSKEPLEFVIQPKGSKYLSLESSTPTQTSFPVNEDNLASFESATQISRSVHYNNSSSYKIFPDSSEVALPGLGVSGDVENEDINGAGEVNSMFTSSTDQAEPDNKQSLYSLFPDLDPDIDVQQSSEGPEPSVISASSTQTDRELAHPRFSTDAPSNEVVQFHGLASFQRATQPHVFTQLQNILHSPQLHFPDYSRSNEFSMGQMQSMGGFVSHANDYEQQYSYDQHNPYPSFAIPTELIMPRNENSRVSPEEMELDGSVLGLRKVGVKHHPQVETVKSEVESLEELKELKHLNALHADASEEAATPKELNVELLPHQKCALCWMTKREKRNVKSEDSVEEKSDSFIESTRSFTNGKGGILADDQGLGKTVSMIALMYNSPPIDDIPWRTLIVCPLSLVGQWRRELENRVKPEFRKRIHTYHGSEKAKTTQELTNYDVVITTYGTVRTEYPKILKDDPRYNHCVEHKLPKPTRKPGLLFSCTWERIIMDEAHNVRNSRTDAWKAVNCLKSDIRWCLTGTPIQNSVDDIYSLLRLVQYRIVNTKEEWKRRWKSKLESKNPQTRKVSFEQFHALLAVVMLRRTKNDKINGRPILDLPARRAHILDQEFIYPEELTMYKKVSEEAVIEFRTVLASGRIRENLSAMFTKFLRLRQACFHPYLIEYCSYRRKLQQLRKSKSEDTPKLSKEERMYAIAMDDTQNGVSVKDVRNGHDYGEEFFSDDDGAHSSDEEFIDQRSTDEIMQEAEEANPDSKFSDTEVDISLQISEPRKRKRRGVDMDDVGSSSGASKDRYGLSYTSDAPYNSSQSCNYRDSFQFNEQRTKQVKREVELSSPTCVKHTFVCSQNTEEETNNIDETRTESNDPAVSKNVVLNPENPGNPKKYEELVTVHGSSSPEEPCAEPGENKKLVGRFLSLKAEFKRKINKAMMKPSTKIKMILEKLEETKKNDSERKSLVFSQWTSCLDILAHHLKIKGYKFCRLDGHMQMNERMKQIEKFEQPEIDVFLVSLRAGGEGLNLIMASQVFILDAWWNPTLEEQAIDRVHRIGQKQDVDIYRFRMANTCENIVYQIADMKRDLINGAIGSGQSHARQQLSWNDLCILFRGEEQNLLNAKT